MRHGRERRRDGDATKAGANSNPRRTRYNSVSVMASRTDQAGAITSVVKAIRRRLRQWQIEARVRQLEALERRFERADRARKGKLSPGESITAPGIPLGSVPWLPSGNGGISAQAGLGRTSTRFRG